jgi:hypothetical protein
VSTLTREAYLLTATERLRPLFTAAGATIPPNIRMACGWPKGRRGGEAADTIGQCWSPTCSADGTFEIFVSPTIADSSRALDILAHELAHAAAGLQCGHRGEFARIARAIGLEGALTATVAGETLRAFLAGIVTELGEYPHAAMRVGSDGAPVPVPGDPLAGPTPGDPFRSGPKKQGTRLIKCECPTCGYLARVTAKWLTTAGAPLCPQHMAPMQASGV